MATFEVPILTIDAIIPIDGADAIEAVAVKGYRSVVPKNQYKVGDKVVYIPEQSLVPDWLITKLGLEGRLAGPDKNRVKAIKLRSCLSQGIILSMSLIENMTFDEDSNMAEVLGIEKWEPVIPAGMAGEFFYYGRGKTIPNFDIENFKKFPTSLKEGELVEYTEKIHGTFSAFTFIVNEDNRAFDNHWLITSKGQGHNGLALYDNEKNRTSNVYVQAAIQNDLLNKFNLGAEKLGITGQFTVMGEVFGSGVQDLTYGFSNGKKTFRGFDVWVGEPSDGHYLNLSEKKAFFDASEVEMVPVLYIGPFSIESMEEFTNGKETVSGKEACIREGIVVRVAEERYEENLGRVILKSVSAAYLLRKGEVTEYT